MDVMVGAVLSTAFAASILDVALPLWYFVAFAGAVWVMYTLDHLTDAHFLHNSAANARHRFHQRHFRLLAVVLVTVSLFVLLIVLSNANQRLIIAGTILGALSLVHLFLVSFDRTKNSWFVQKELMVALVYTSGVWVGPALILGEIPSWPVLAMLSAFGVTVWIEGAMMAYVERNADQVQKTPSIVSKLGASKTIKLIRLMTVLLILLSLVFALAFSAQLRWGWFILLTMNVLLLILQQEKYAKQTSGFFHLLGELVFWLPGIILFF